MASQIEIEAAAAALLNARNARKGVPAIPNVVEILRGGGDHMCRVLDELMDDARAALEAAEHVRTG